MQVTGKIFVQLAIRSGVSAIAYATDIAYSLDPASSLFIQGRMRRHLYQCLNAGRFTPFPWKPTSTTLTLLVGWGKGMRLKSTVIAGCPVQSKRNG